MKSASDAFYCFLQRPFPPLAKNRTTTTFFFYVHAKLVPNMGSNSFLFPLVFHITSLGHMSRARADSVAGGSRSVMLPTVVVKPRRVVRGRPTSFRKGGRKEGRKERREEGREGGVVFRALLNNAFRCLPPHRDGSNTGQHTCLRASMFG